MDRGTKAAGGTLMKKVAISTATVDRIVGGRYEWRDGSYRKRPREEGGGEGRDG